MDHPVRSARLQRVIKADLRLDRSGIICNLDLDRSDVDGRFLVFEDLSNDLFGCSIAASKK
jgi:hypothetical protein